MFHQDKIKSIKPNDRVLEIGPGGSPHQRSDVFLEKIYDTEEAKGQRGYAPPLETDKEIVYYDGHEFPFVDDEFDYVICSHVLEHVDDVDYFLSEINRVSKRGYLEYPTIYYDYIYNFVQHTNFIIKRDNTILWMPKEESGLQKFKKVNVLFNISLAKGYSDIVNDLKDYFFEGFEWSGYIQSKRVNDIDILCYSSEEVSLETKVEKHDLEYKQDLLKEHHNNSLLEEVISRLRCIKKQLWKYFP